MLQMNYTGSRWPESNHLASFAWDFSMSGIEQICTYSKRTKEGVFATKERQFKRGSLCKWWLELSYNMRPCNKDKMLWIDWLFEAIQAGSDTPLRTIVYCAWSGCYFKCSTGFYYPFTSLDYLFVVHSWSPLSYLECSLFLSLWLKICCYPNLQWQKKNTILVQCVAVSLCSRAAYKHQVLICSSRSFFPWLDWLIFLKLHFYAVFLCSSLYWS